MAGIATLSDLDLMKRIANYDSRSLEVLYNRYSSILYTLIKKIVGDQAIAEQTLIDVFVIIWRKISFFDVKIGDTYCWLIMLARNKAVDTLKRKKGIQLPDYTDDYENKIIIPQISPQIDDLDLATALSIKGNIENALNKLTEAQQYVIYLGFYEGLSESEIADKLKIPALTVKSKIKVALSNLRDNLLKGGQ